MECSGPAEGEIHPIPVGVIGLGFMGRQHVLAWRAADAAGWPNRLHAVADPNAERRRGQGLFNPQVTAAYASAQELLEDPCVEIVSICTPTDSHVDLAIAALAAGKHVLVEKPIALRAKDVERLADAARRAPGQRCLPAMCMRFWPDWDLLRNHELDLGRVRRARFTRVSSAPSWAPAFYQDTARSGGVLFDLHVHDADLVLWLLGAPTSVETSGGPLRVLTRYRYASGIDVTAEAAWDAPEGTPFVMAYEVEFERGALSYALGREPACTLRRGSETTPLPLPPITGYDGQVRHLVDAVRDPALPLCATVDEAVAVTLLLEAEARSLARRAPVTMLSE